MVEKIMELFPVAMHDMDAKKKNIVLLAVENRQTYLYEFLLKRKTSLKESILGKSITTQTVHCTWQPSLESISLGSLLAKRLKCTGKSSGSCQKRWRVALKTAESCSVVAAALIATVAFSASTAVPGGLEETVIPLKAGQNSKHSPSHLSLLFAVRSQQCCSPLLTSRFQEKDFGRNFPWKLILGLKSLFMSITAMMVSLSIGHFFVLKDKLRSAAYPVYAITCLPVTLFALAQFPQYIDLIWAILKKVLQRGYKTSLV
ncbi:hypothetical protein RJT34_13900 [Clitoria ternatea]|uniref:PGG domain-containing protein n=1 Tax=Clitoria ternatea TaxID=43366 RepID=A0AAN9JRX2_CLITE